MNFDNSVNLIFNETKSLLGNVDNEKLMKFNIELLVQESLNYMNRKDFPSELILTAVKYIIATNSQTETSNVKSMSVGDTKIEYVEVDPDKFIKDLRSRLNLFRKVGTI